MVDLNLLDWMLNETLEATGRPDYARPVLRESRKAAKPQSRKAAKPQSQKMPGFNAIRLQGHRHWAPRDNSIPAKE